MRKQKDTYVPERRPAHQVRVVNLALGIYVLAGTNHHGFGRSDVDQRGLSRIGVRDPYRDWKSVGCSSEHDRYGARQMEQEGRHAGVKGCSRCQRRSIEQQADRCVRRTVNIGTRRQRRVLRQSLGHVVIGAVHVVVFLATGKTG